MKILEGKKAPVFELVSASGETIELKKYLGKKNIVLYFYPKDDTPGCTQQACGFRDAIKTIEKADAVVLGVSADSLAAHTKFQKKYDLPFDLLSDSEKAVIKKYDVWKEKSMYGKKYMGIERTTFVIDKKGMIRKIFPKVKVAGHVDEVLEILSAL